MRNREMCSRCKYRGGAVDSPSLMFCNYAAITDETCLKRVGNQIIDIRGKDMNDCKLFDEGRPVVRRKEEEEYEESCDDM